MLEVAAERLSPIGPKNLQLVVERGGGADPALDWRMDNIIVEDISR